MKGLIGFFDILGYKNFLENNSATESALEVLKIITDIPKEIKLISQEVVKTTPNAKDLDDRLKHLVFSDTIVFTLDYPENVDAEWIDGARNFMAAASATLTAKMFKNGLPVRGVIHEGDFIIKDMCFAGKGIVEAYQLCEALNFSGLVYSPSLGNKILGTEEGKNFNNDYWTTFTYLTPMKDGNEIKLLNSNWVYILKGLEENGFLEFQKDIEGFVLKTFWAHNKDCSNSVDIKIKNTVKIIRKMMHNIQLHNP
ncbi:MAG: hypothetical protein PHD39_09135 [Methylobacter tundripaludum]|nr:hypothetical protein [Methylobacter tundripaludum]